MGSRDDTTPHQPFLSSLVVRPSDSGGGGGSDYEPGEVRRDAPPYSRSDRYSEDTGYRARPVSVSPVRRREIDRRYSPELDRLDDSPPPRAFGGGRGDQRSPGRYRDYSPPHSRGRGGRSFGRGFGGRGFGPGAGRGEGMHRNNTNVRPREGDWYCSDPMCGNLNFARREFCNNCKRHRHAPVSPRRGYGGPPPPMGPPRRFPGPPPMGRSPGRFINGYRSPPPRGWPRDGPRDFGPGGPPPPRHDGRFADHHLRRDHHRPDFPEEDFRDRGKFDRPPPAEWGPRDHYGKDGFMDRKSYERRPLSPPGPAPPGRGRWADRDIRERSRSPIRGGPPPKDFRREPYMGRGRDERRGVGRDRVGNVY
ncbi:uncharacterized protein LOC141605918 [Silene latifolia]|uniref:uncharacterized protein LOC141605918 n=1 Tax=Silene latifolia TaxID=37657 RepID=UPI003D785F51